VASASRVIGAFASNPVSASGDTVVWTPAAGARIRLRWVGLSTPDTNASSVLAKWRFGTGDYFWHWLLGKPGAFAHGALREGDVDEPLKINLDAAVAVYVAFDLEEF
jgi:hypothetical protein